MTQGLYLLSPVSAVPADVLLKSIDAVLKNRPADAFLYDEGMLGAEELSNIIPAVQKKDIAFILKGDPETALRLNADGVHIPYSDDLKNIRKKTDGIALGVMCAGRDQAMRAGEAGADYVGFEKEDAAELARWWSGLFTIPCVVFNPQTPCPQADFEVLVLNV